ncbi:MAG: hypothetical protein NVS3B20_18430 [Polyangiales bacterium]
MRQSVDANETDEPTDAVARLRQEIGALHEKYREMQLLRRERSEDTERGVIHHPPRDRLRALARRFPGALAEIDRISPALLAARLSQIESILATLSVHASEPRIPAMTTAPMTPMTFDALPPWVRGWIAVHRGLRGALAAKAWLRGARSVDRAKTAQFAKAVREGTVPSDAQAWIERLAEVASPPNGRLVDVVFDDAARMVGLDRVALRLLLMPRPSHT